MISVVIPVYDQPVLLREALESVKKQTASNVEAIVVDDASPEPLDYVVSSFGEWAKYVRHDINKGAPAARNTGIKNANGEYVSFLDADDIWASEKLERQLAVFEEGGPSLGLTYTGFVQYEVDGNKWEHHPEARGNIYIEELERDRVHPTSTVMARRDVIKEVGGFDTSLPSRQDYDLWIRVTEQYRVDYVDEILVKKREQSDSISKDFQSRIEGDLRVFEKVKERASELDFTTRTRIYSYHNHVIGRDCESNGDRWKALKHLGLAILRYPLRPISWVMFVIVLLGIDRNGPFLNFVKRLIR